MFNSTIKRKKCKGDCGRYPVLGLSGWCYKCVPDDIKERAGTKKEVAKRNRNARNRTSALLKKDSEADKRSLLLMADKLFGDFIKMRDSDEQGNIKCVCCGLPFHLKDKDSGGDYIVQCLHFIPRGVYVLRFYENNASAGCSYCNLQMHLNPNGREYVSFRNKLVNTIGELKVSDMELCNRHINKLTAKDLEEIIDKYKTAKP